MPHGLFIQIHYFDDFFMGCFFADLTTIWGAQILQPQTKSGSRSLGKHSDE